MDQGTDPTKRPSNVPRPAPLSPVAETSHGDVRALFDQALELATGGQTEAALSALDALTGLDRSFIKAHTLKGSLFLAASRFEEAGREAETALSLDPLCIEALLMLGIIARHADRDDDARKKFREAIFLDPACWLAHFHIAEIAFRLEDRKRARSAYATAQGILEKGPVGERGKDFFPLSVNAEPFLAVCRHKLSILRDNG